MPAGKLIFSQLTDWIHPEQFRRCVNRYAGNYKVYNVPCWDQFLAMAFAQIIYRESLADIEVCLRSRPDQLYRMGFRSTVAHRTLADGREIAEKGYKVFLNQRHLLKRVLETNGLDDAAFEAGGPNGYKKFMSGWEACTESMGER
jgi:hypothetical protein